MRIPLCLLFVLAVALAGCPDDGVQGDDDTVQSDDDDDLLDDDDSAPCDAPLGTAEVSRAEANEKGSFHNCDELNVELVSNQEDYEERFQALFPHTASSHGIPAGIDFGTSTLILSHITFCGATGYDLIVDWVCTGDGAIDVYESLWHPEDGYLGETGIPYNLTTVPKGEYLGVEGHLTEVYPGTNE